MGNSVASSEPDIPIVLSGQHGWKLHRSGRTELAAGHSDQADEQDQVYLTHQAATNFKDNIFEHSINWVKENLSTGFDPSLPVPKEDHLFEWCTRLKWEGLALMLRHGLDPWLDQTENTLQDVCIMFDSLVDTNPNNARILLHCVTAGGQDPLGFPVEWRWQCIQSVIDNQKEGMYKFFTRYELGMQRLIDQSTEQEADVQWAPLHAVLPCIEAASAVAIKQGISWKENDDGSIGGEDGDTKRQPFSFLTDLLSWLDKHDVLQRASPTGLEQALAAVLAGAGEGKLDANTRTTNSKRATASAPASGAASDSDSSSTDSIDEDEEAGDPAHKGGDDEDNETEIGRLEDQDEDEDEDSDEDEDEDSHRYAAQLQPNPDRQVQSAVRGLLAKGADLSLIDTSWHAQLQRCFGTGSGRIFEPLMHAFIRHGDRISDTDTIELLPTRFGMQDEFRADRCNNLVWGPKGPPSLVLSMCAQAGTKPNRLFGALPFVYAEHDWRGRASLHPQRYIQMLTVRELEAIQRHILHHRLRVALPSARHWMPENLEEGCEIVDSRSGFRDDLIVLGIIANVGLRDRGLHWLALMPEMVIAAANGDEECLRLALHIACSRRVIPPLSCCKIPVGPYNRDPAASTLLLAAKMACIADQGKSMDLLLEQGLDVDDAALGATLVQVCLKFNSGSALQILLRHGADPSGACMPADSAAVDRDPADAVCRGLMQDSLSCDGDTLAVARRTRMQLYQVSSKKYPDCLSYDARGYRQMRADAAFALDKRQHSKPRGDRISEHKLACSFAVLIKWILKYDVWPGLHTRCLPQLGQPCSRGWILSSERWWCLHRVFLAKQMGMWHDLWPDAVFAVDMPAVEVTLFRVLMEGDMAIAESIIRLLAESTTVDAWRIASSLGRVLVRCLNIHLRKASCDSMSTVIGTVLVHELEDLSCGAGRWAHRREPHVAQAALQALDQAVGACAQSLDGEPDPVFESLMARGWTRTDVALPRLDTDGFKRLPNTVDAFSIGEFPQEACRASDAEQVVDLTLDARVEMSSPERRRTNRTTTQATASVELAMQSPNKATQLAFYKHGHPCDSPIRDTAMLLWCIREGRLGDARMLMEAGVDPLVRIKFEIDNTICPSRAKAATDQAASDSIQRNGLSPAWSSVPSPHCTVEPYFLKRAREAAVRCTKQWGFNDNDAISIASSGPDSNRRLVTLSGLSLAVYLQQYDLVEWMLVRELAESFTSYSGSSERHRDRDPSNLSSVRTDVKLWAIGLRACILYDRPAESIHVNSPNSCTEGEGAYGDDGASDDVGRDDGASGDRGSDDGGSDDGSIGSALYDELTSEAAYHQQRSYEGMRSIVLDSDECSPIRMAIRRNDLCMLRILIHHLHRSGCLDINAIDAAGSTPLQWACAYERLEAVEILLEAGASLDAPVTSRVHLKCLDWSGKISWYCEYDDQAHKHTLTVLEVLMIILSRHGDCARLVQLLDCNHLTRRVTTLSLVLNMCLEEAVSNGQLEAVKAIAQHPLWVIDDGLVDIFEHGTSSNAGLPSCAQVLLHHGVDMDQIVNHEDGPLFKLCTSDCLSVRLASRFIESRCSVDSTESVSDCSTNGSSASSALLSRGNATVLKWVLESGGDPELNLSSLWEEVHNLRHDGDSMSQDFLNRVNACVQLLLRHGAQPTVRSKVPQMFLEYARGLEDYMPLFVLAAAGLPNVLYTVASAFGQPIPREALDRLLAASIVARKVFFSYIDCDVVDQGKHFYDSCASVLLSVGASPFAMCRDLSIKRNDEDREREGEEEDEEREPHYPEPPLVLADFAAKHADIETCLLLARQEFLPSIDMLPVIRQHVGKHIPDDADLSDPATALNIVEKVPAVASFNCIIVTVKEGGSGIGAVCEFFRVCKVASRMRSVRYLEPSRRLRVMAFRRAHEAQRDARLVFGAAARGRPLELGKRLRLGKLAGGLDAHGSIAPGGPIISALEAAQVGGHEQCVKVLKEASAAPNDME